MVFRLRQLMVFNKEKGDENTAVQTNLKSRRLSEHSL